MTTIYLVMLCTIILQTYGARTTHYAFLILMRTLRNVLSPMAIASSSTIINRNALIWYACKTRYKIT